MIVGSCLPAVFTGVIFYSLLLHGKNGGDMKQDKIKMNVALIQDRTMTVGQVIDLVITGKLRREVELGKESFAEFIGVDRKTVRSYEDFSAIPKLGIVFDIAQKFKIKIKMNKDE